jgi:hypothetical protein
MATSKQNPAAAHPSARPAIGHTPPAEADANRKAKGLLESSEAEARKLVRLCAQDR